MKSRAVGADRSPEIALFRVLPGHAKPLFLLLFDGTQSDGMGTTSCRGHFLMRVAAVLLKGTANRTKEGAVPSFLKIAPEPQKLGFLIPQFPLQRPAPARWQR
jgi:hypothetical protein